MKKFSLNRPRRAFSEINFACSSKEKRQTSQRVDFFPPPTTSPLPHFSPLCSGTVMESGRMEDASRFSKHVCLPHHTIPPSSCEALWCVLRKKCVGRYTLALATQAHALTQGPVSSSLADQPRWHPTTRQRELRKNGCQHLPPIRPQRLQALFSRLGS